MAQSFILNRSEKQPTNELSNSDVLPKHALCNPLIFPTLLAFASPPYLSIKDSPSNKESSCHIFKYQAKSSIGYTNDSQQDGDSCWPDGGVEAVVDAIVSDNFHSA